MRIGEIVQSHIGAIFDYCGANPEELSRLMSLDYSKQQFDLQFPFCWEAADIPLRLGTGKQSRYWSKEYPVCGKLVRVTNHWWRKKPQMWAGFALYIAKKGIIGEREKDEIIAAGLDAARGEPVRKQGGYGHKKSTQGRYGVKAMGDAQNIFVRHILGNLGIESLSESDWTETKTHFGGMCVYCGEAESKEKKLVIDHAVPINRNSMGEHRLGNLVPSCNSCNKKKHSKDYRDFLADNAIARQAIEDYMQSRGYSPLENRENAEEVREVLEEAYRALEPLAEEYIRKLNALLG